MAQTLAALLLALALTLFPKTALAQSAASDGTAAETLFADGRRLMAAGMYAEACAQFRESQRLDSGIGTLLNLGRCYAKQGKTASAWSAYAEAAALARAAGQHERERIARLEIEALEPELSKVRVRVAPQPSGAELRITLNGRVLDWTSWGSEMPLDPGDYELVASAPQRRTWSQRFVVRKGTHRTLDVPALAPLPNPWTTQHTVAVVEAGVGVVALALGGYLTLSAHSDYDAGGKYCESDNRCTEEGFDLRERAITKARLAGISFVVAGAALAGAGVLWFTAPSLKTHPTRDHDVDRSPQAWSVGFRRSW